jgi:toxin ParE1/3/4
MGDCGESLIVRRLRFTEDAERNLVDIARYIASESQSREIALAFVERLRFKCRHLASLPGTLGTARPDLRDDMRSTPCQGDVIFFRYQGNVLDVANVLHGSRDVVWYFEE